MKRAFLPGDGTGQEVTAQGVEALRPLEQPLALEQAPIGEGGIERCDDDVGAMLRLSIERPDTAPRIEPAVRNVLRAGLRTADIVEPGMRQLGAEDMGDAIAADLRRNP